ncbi:hypothetical protein LTR84_009422 [Exophiala bonariae]|uniref:FAD/NAD(P)-binding domain-containing protein n=1 Tax=Exophiala bonariae TaxID=1690606 RepID=A0AAV9MUM0_9EURO|nr:hypothetical protein LTR84_009422 [Exophiala bonariae]
MDEYFGTPLPANDVLDVLIVGAGISGINAGYRIQSQFPKYTYTILEGRGQMGGTWDLFRYPGIRSDSDLFTFGFEWNPWEKLSPIADGESIRQYLHKSASMHGIDKKIQYGHLITNASWSSKDCLWTLTALYKRQQLQYKARFLVFGTGYYNYNEPLEAKIPKIEQFQGQTIHPQFWPEDLDYTNKQIVVIGSGATAITLVPSLAEKAAKVTMLQRSPTYILSIPNKAFKRPWYSHLLSQTLYFSVQRLLWIIRGRLFIWYCHRWPDGAKRMIEKSTTQQLPVQISYDPHFNPSYRPWQQRVCICPDGDFFKSLQSGKATVETSIIQEVVPDGIVLASGKKLAADIIVTATGLRLQMFGGIKIEVDGKLLDPREKYMWNGMMIQDMPNAAFCFGYTDASWTLGADVTAKFICKYLKYLERQSYRAAVPYLPESISLLPAPTMNLQSTYVTLGAANLPRSAVESPWTGRKGFILDYAWMKLGRLDRGLTFIR